MVVAYNLSKSEKEGLEAVIDFEKEAMKHGYTILGLSASGDNDYEAIKNEYGFVFDFFFCDETALKTSIRSNPGIIHLENGVVKQKLHWNDLDKFQF